MDTKQFKSIFSDVAKAHGFTYNFSGWFIQSAECLLVIGLQKSNYANTYYLNIKVFFRSPHRSEIIPTKEVVKNETGDVFLRSPKDFDACLDLDADLTESARKEGLESLFTQFMDPFAALALTRPGLLKLAEEGKVYLLPGVREKILAGIQQAASNQ